MKSLLLGNSGRLFDFGWGVIKSVGHIGSERGTSRAAAAPKANHACVEFMRPDWLLTAAARGRAALRPDSAARRYLRESLSSRTGGAQRSARATTCGTSSGYVWIVR